MCYDVPQEMKKADRIETMLGDLGLGESDYHECYRGYFQCFNAGRYYEAHDVLEHLWLRETGPEYAFYKGLIQIAGAFVHLKKQFERPTHPTDGRRLHPATRLFAIGIRNIEPFGPHHMGLDITTLCTLCRSQIEKIEASNFAINPWSPGTGPQLALGPRPGEANHNREGGFA